MINSPDLPTGHCYLEYPDGSIKIATADSGRIDFIIVGELDYFNAKILKRQLKIK